MSGILNLTEVLVVEDSKPDYKLVELAIGRSSEFDLSWATNLADAFTFLDQRTEKAVVPIDVILLDLNLPDSKGLETLTRTRSKYKAVPIVVLTGDDDSIGLKAARRGAQDYLVKGSLDTMLLTKAIKWAIERNRLQQLLIEHLRVDVLGMEKSKLLPTCASCQRVRNPADGQWVSLYDWLEEWADLYLSHGICPDCAKEHYGDLIEQERSSRRATKKKTGPLVSTDTTRRKRTSEDAS